MVNAGIEKELEKAGASAFRADVAHDLRIANGRG